MASGGKEIFLTFCTQGQKKLYSLLRLRIPPQENALPVLKNMALIREIHTYGRQIPFSKKGDAPQHRGLGKKLLKEAEKIARREYGKKGVAVIAAVGARDYFRKLGYELKEEYMIKILS